MDGDTDILRSQPVTRRRLTVAEFHRLGDAGILGADDRVELLEGQLVSMSPIGPRHALVVDALAETLVIALRGRAAVRIQNPVSLGRHTEPQPDVAIIRRPWHGYPAAHPGPADIHLIVEVADATLTTDLGAKRDLYAAAGIAEYWVVDLERDRIHVFRRPRRLEATAAYEELLQVEGTQTLAPAELARLDIAPLEIEVSSILSPRWQ